MEMLRNLIHEGIDHHGFACIDVLQICASYCNLTDYYDRNVYELIGHDPSDFEQACIKAREWDYSRKAPIGTGLFYRNKKKTFEEQFKRTIQRPEERTAAVRRVLESKI
jgi:2-oxoglutarate ferredoxin oxidoreductase subunit beta